MAIAKMTKIMVVTHRSEAKELIESLQHEGITQILDAEKAMASSDARFPYLLGQIYLKQRAYKEAEPAYLRAIELRPEYYSAYYGLGMAYSRLKQSAQARTAMSHFRSLKTEAEASPEQQIMMNELSHARKRIVALYIQAYNLYDPHNEGAAGVRLIRRALALDAEDAHTWEKLGGHFYVTGRQNQALKSFQNAVSLDPNNPLPRLNIGKLYAQMNQMERAEAALQKAVVRFPTSGLVHAELAHLYLRSQTHYGEALALIKKAVALDPTANHYFLLTWAYDVRGDPKSAIKAIQKAMTLEPKNSRYRSTYERIRAKL
jgi:protein O-GlcNAc transferase